MSNRKKRYPSFRLTLISLLLFSSTVSAQSFQRLNDSVFYYYNKGLFDKAILFAEQARLIARQESGDNSKNYATSLNNLVILYSRVENYTQAEPLYVELVNIQKKLLGVEHPTYATTLNNLGGLYESMGNYAKAEPLFVEALSIRKKIFGEENLDYAQSLNNLAGLYVSTDRYAKTEPLYIEALTIHKKLLGVEHPSYAISLNNLAFLYYEMGDYAKAEPLFIEAMNIRRRVLGEEHPSYATGLNNLAGLYHKMGNYVKAEPFYVESINIYKKNLGIEHPDYANSLNNLAGLYTDLGNYSKAEPLFEEVMRIYKKTFGSEHPSYAQSLNSLGLLYFKTGNFVKAEPLYVEAIKIYKNVLGEESLVYAQCLSNLAALYATTGNYSKAESLYLEALNIRKKVVGAEHPDYAQSLNNLGALYSDLGNYLKAEPFYLEALDIRKKVLGTSHPNYANSLNNLASLYESLGNILKAETLYNEALEIRKNVLGTEHPDYANSLNNLAGMYESMGNFSKAEILYKEAIYIFKKILGIEHTDYANTLNNLAGLYKTIGNYDKAEGLYLEALDVYKKVLGAEHPDYANSLNNLATLYRSTGNYSKAESLHLEAVRINKKILGLEHPDYAISLNNLGLLYFKMGNYSKAEPLYIEAMTIYKKVFGVEHPEYATSLNNLASLYDNLGNYTKSEALYKEALSIRRKVFGVEHPDYAQCLYNLGFLYNSMGNYAKSEHLFTGGFDTYIKHLLQNFTSLTEMEKELWLNENVYLNGVLLSLPYNHTAVSSATTKYIFNQQLLLKSMLLADTRMVVESIQKSNDSLLKKTYDSWMAIKRNLSRQYALPVNKRSPELASWEQRSEELEKQLNRSSVVFREQQQKLRIKMAEVQNGLQEQEACVEFVKFKLYQKKWTDSILYGAFIVTKSDTVPRFVPLFEERQLQQIWTKSGATNELKVKNLYRGSTESDSSFSEALLGKDVYRLVWQPLEPYLKGIKKVAYAPAGLLYKIAFHALPVDSTTVLMDKYLLRQYTSIRDVALRYRNSGYQQPNQIVLFGNPDYAKVSQKPATTNSATTGTQSVTTPIYTPGTRGSYNNSWLPLSGTAEEIKKIKQLFENNKIHTTQFVKQEATEERLKALSGQSPQVLHIATHGFFLPQAEQNRNDIGTINTNQYSFADNPLLRSGLILAGANDAWNGKSPVEGAEDGIVTAYEIAQLNLSNTELVVLSACETALGEIKGGEGVFGLQRAFKLAGVKKMIVSLWQVPDKETAELMTSFYGYWLKGSTMQEAFARAQSEMRKKYPAFYWAAFVLVE